MPIILSEAGFKQFVENPPDESFLQWATDLFTLATGLDDMPTDALEGRIVARAIYQMGWKLLEDHNNQEAYMSQFSSERIGSYSYSKMAQDIEAGGTTGVSEFDYAVMYFGNKSNKSNFTVSSEHVFTQGYRPDSL